MKKGVKKDCCGRATLSNDGAYTLFSFAGKRIRFSAPYSLKRYLRVKKWIRGYLEVLAEYEHGVVEDYIDLEPILENLLIDPGKFLKPIKTVEIGHAGV